MCELLILSSGIFEQFGIFFTEYMNGHVTVRVEHSPVGDAMPPGLRFAILLDISEVVFFIFRRMDFNGFYFKYFEFDLI